MKTPDHFIVPPIESSHYEKYVGPLPASPKALSVILRGIEHYTLQRVKAAQAKGDRDIYDESGQYSYFKPPWHAEKELINRDVVCRLLKPSTRALFVGSGPALLERMLVESLSVPKGNIVVSDIELHEGAQQMDVEKWQFDMFGRWPLYWEKFDYVIFPESFGVAAVHYKDEIAKDPACKAELDVFEEALFEIYVGCLQDRELANIYRQFSVLFKMLFLLIKVLDKAVFYLKEGGEIRLGSLAVMNQFPQWQEALSKALQTFGFHHVQMEIRDSVIVFTKIAETATSAPQKHAA